MVRKMCALVFTFRAKPVQLPRQRSGDARGDDSDVPSTGINTAAIAVRSEEPVAKPWRNEMFDIEHLQKEAGRYRSEARHAATNDRRKYLTLMAKLSETLASNEIMRAWLDDSIAELKSGAPLRTSRP